MQYLKKRLISNPSSIAYTHMLTYRIFHYIIKISNEGEFILFADDTNIFVRSQTAMLAFKTANEILRKVNDYMYVNKLYINMEKCCFIFILNLVTRKMQLLQNLMLK